MYVYLLGLAVSNLCVLITAVPALFEMGGVKFAVMDEASIQTSSFSFNPEQIIINTAPLMHYSPEFWQVVNMEYLHWGYGICKGCRYVLSIEY